VKKESLIVGTAKIAYAGAVTFFIWKALQYMIGDKIDRKIEASRRT